MSDRLEALRTLRDQLEQWMPEAPVDRRASLVGQYRATLEEIAELEPKKAQGDGVDEIAKRRAARRASSPTRPSRAKRQG